VNRAAPVSPEGTAPRKIYRGRLFRKYFFSIIALVSGVLLLSGGISVYFSYQENKLIFQNPLLEPASG
jgi:hypothetical protein